MPSSTAERLRDARDAAFQRLQEVRARARALPPPPPQPQPHPVTLLTPSDLLIDFLASYRLTHLVTTDRITAPVRDHLLDKARAEQQEDFEGHPSHLTRSAAYLVTCDYCVSVYTSALLAAFHLVPATSPAGAMLRTARYALATAGAVSAFREVMDR